MRKLLKVPCAVIAIVAAAGLGYFIYLHFMARAEEEKVFELAAREQTEVIIQAVKEMPDSETAPIEINWEELRELNPDIKAWIHIPDTYISFPLLQEQVLGEYYYLDHNYKGERLATGAVFTPAEPIGAEDAHTLVFAHHTGRENLGFSGLQTLFGSKETAEKNPRLYVLYPDRTEMWRIWCGVNGKADDPVYEIPYLIETESYAGLLQDIERRALFLIGNRPAASDKTVVLSTCNGPVGTDDRFYAVFVKGE